ncbi:hypothetical protein SAMN02745857_00317 [Andreprevotia lacus DSM 23236]|jgi:hypothetical protein|uniref:SnoaL-like domain-containing protein n=1 Tax=Andreprevotia lacus DSM 23236 TaxID=1121001 RepID=A0A1W1WZ96_9NEIS|nr:hypothetical protein [Andreprevotia lacus]SMC17056.1 hypothetical protein SAMN02745857_00317 [Andreprevotia lacus DSM 23236]
MKYLRLGKLVATILGGVILAGSVQMAQAAELPAGSAQAMDKYLQAWVTDDAAQRKQLLEQAVSTDFSYRDPGAYKQGRESLINYIVEVRHHYNDLQARWLGPAVWKGDVFERPWRMERANGDQLFTGVDKLEFDQEGRLKTLVGRFE